VKYAREQMVPQIFVVRQPETTVLSLFTEVSFSGFSISRRTCR
jgi:hypothetical protein